MRDATFMEMALAIAFRHIGLTSPNPAVGAVIVKGDAVVASGGTQSYGRDHAEVVALKGAGADAIGAEMYVTLEPCNHYGNTPPCTKAIIEAGIRRVVIGTLDPNPQVAGSGAAALRDAGIDVLVLTSHSSMAADLIRPFKKYILRNRPYVIHKSAVTLDGRVATDTGDSKWISSSASRLMVHRLRSRVDAVVVGKGTFMADNPSLSVRPEDFSEDDATVLQDAVVSMRGYDNYYLRSLLAVREFGNRQPLPVLMGVPDDVDWRARLFKGENVLIFESREKIARLKNKSLPPNVSLVPLESVNHIDHVDEMLLRLSERGCMTILLEGGSRLAGTFHDSGAIDQYISFIAPTVLGSGVPVLKGIQRESMGDALPLRDISTFGIGTDLLYSGYREQFNFEMM